MEQWGICIALEIPVCMHVCCINMMCFGLYCASRCNVWPKHIRTHSPQCAQDDPCTAAPCPARHICRPTRVRCIRREGCAELQRECSKYNYMYWFIVPFYLLHTYTAYTYVWVLQTILHWLPTPGTGYRTKSWYYIHKQYCCINSLALNLCQH